MLVVDSTTKKIQVVLSGAVATNQAHVYAAWRDIKADGTFTPSNQDTETNNTTDVDLVPSPAASTYRVVDYASVYNNDTAAITVTVKFDNNGTERIFLKATLQSGESLEYQEGSGWNVRNASGVRKLQTTSSLGAASLMMSPAFATANLTSVKTITSGSSFALYIGKAPRALTQVQIRLRVITAMATVTWGEVALAKGTPTLGGNPSLTVVGYANVSGTYNSTGQKSTTINVSSGQAVNEGDDLWVIVGNSATTALVIRAQSIADDLQAGFQASAAQRPSLIVGTPTSFTVEGATTLAGWIVMQI